MRHLGSIGLLVTFAATAIAPGDGDAAPLDFLFGGPPLASRPAYRLRSRPAPPPTRAIPLPVPRPHFPDDPTPKAEVQAPAEPKPAKSEATQKVTPAPAPPALKLPDKPMSKPADAMPPSRAAPSEPPPVATAPETENPFVAPRHDTSRHDAAPAPEPGEPPAPAPPPPVQPAQVTPKPVAPAQPDSLAPAPGPWAPPTPPPRPADLATPPPLGKAEPIKPEPIKPTVAPSGATLAFTPRAPEDDPQCPSRLLSQKVGIEQITLGPQPDARCTVVEPVHLADVTMADGSKVAFPEHPTIACVTADSFSSYVRDMLSPLAKGTFGAPVTAVWTGPGLECRSRDHIFGAKLSAHGQGLAIDIAKLKLADGRVIEVGTPTTAAETAFETAARAGACGYFHTVLGPGSDSYHRTHWHFDLEVRGAHGDSKYCK